MEAHTNVWCSPFRRSMCRFWTSSGICDMNFPIRRCDAGITEGAFLTLTSLSTLRQLVQSMSSPLLAPSRFCFTSQPLGKHQRQRVNHAIVSLGIRGFCELKR